MKITSKLQCFNFIHFILVILTPRIWEGVSNPTLDVHKLVVASYVDPVLVHLMLLLLTTRRSSSSHWRRLLCKYSVDPPCTLSIQMEPGTILEIFVQAPMVPPPCQCHLARVLLAVIVIFVKVIFHMPSSSDDSRRGLHTSNISTSTSRPSPQSRILGSKNRPGHTIPCMAQPSGKMLLLPSFSDWV